MKPENKKPFIYTLSIMGVAALAVMFARWRIDLTDAPTLTRAAALVSVLLFAAVGLRTVPRWAEFWSEGAAVSSPEPPALRSGKLFLALLGWDAAILLLAWPLRCLITGPISFAESMKAWVCGDGIHYLDIARDWYLSEGSVDRLVQLVFLPGYPLLIRLARVVLRDWTAAALAVSGLSYAGAGTLLYRLLRLDCEERTARRGLMVFLLTPGFFFFPAAMSESLFLLCCIGCIYLARRGKWLFAGLCGAYAAFTRSLGITLLVPLVMELVHGMITGETPKNRRLPACASLLLVPLGFAAYLLINKQVAGDPFQFLTYQSEHWHQRFGLFFSTAAYQTDYALGTVHDNPHNFYGLWLPNLIASFAALGVMIYGAGKIRASYSVWFLPYYFIAIGATWLLSAPRYLAAFFPLSAAMAAAGEKKGPRAVLFAVLGTLSALYFLAFIARWQVW